MEQNFYIEPECDTKSSPFVLFHKDDIKGDRTRAGIYAVMGNRDNVGDRVMPGAFKKTMSDNRKNIVHLWDHGLGEMTMPTAKIEDLYEIGKSDIPDEVFKVAPDATGAAVVVRTYLDTPYSLHLLKAVDAGAITQMSFAYRIPKGKSEILPERIGGEEVQTRVIREVMQKDTSDVKWGANGATIAQFKSLVAFAAKFTDDELFKALEDFLAECKAGARNSAMDGKRIQQIHDLCKQLSPDCCGDQPSKSAPTAPDEDQAFSVGLALARARAGLQEFQH